MEEMENPASFYGFAGTPSKPRRRSSSSSGRPKERILDMFFLLEHTCLHESVENLAKVELDTTCWTDDEKLKSMVILSSYGATKEFKARGKLWILTFCGIGNLEIRVLCGVNHSNLKHLILVSKAIHEAALIAKEVHFDFSTPNSKLIKATAKGDNIESVNELDDSHETPNAPLRVPGTRLGCKDLSRA